jgi:hypothetical protein
MTTTKLVSKGISISTLFFVIIDVLLCICFPTIYCYRYGWDGKDVLTLIEISVCAIGVWCLCIAVLGGTIFVFLPSPRQSVSSELFTSWTAATFTLTLLFVASW